MENDRTTSWTGWFLLALSLGLFHLAIITPLAFAMASSQPWVLKMFFAFGLLSESGRWELTTLANSLAYGALASLGVYCFRLTR